MTLSRRSFLAAAAGVVLPLQSGAGVSVEGQVFEDRVVLGGTPLTLNGTGVRAVAWFKGYAAGLYLAQRASTAAQVEAQAGPKRLQLRMLQDVPAAEFTKAFRKGVTRNCTPAQLAALGDRLDRFAGLIDGVGKVRKGDVIDLDLDPPRGLLFAINGKLRGAPISGDEFYAALLRAFVGEQPYDEKLRAGLLGRRA
jgi:Chalcone isomerase-like